MSPSRSRQQREAPPPAHSTRSPACILPPPRSHRTTLPTTGLVENHRALSHCHGWVHVRNVQRESKAQKNETVSQSTPVGSYNDPWKKLPVAHKPVKRSLFASSRSEVMKQPCPAFQAWATDISTHNINELLIPKVQIVSWRKCTSLWGVTAWSPESNTVLIQSSLIRYVWSVRRGKKDGERERGGNVSLHIGIGLPVKSISLENN